MCCSTATHNRRPRCERQSVPKPYGQSEENVSMSAISVHLPNLTNVVAQRMMTKQLQPSASYVTLLKEIKERVHSAQVCAAFAVNGELILLYWQVGRDISSRFDGEGWGTKVSTVSPKVLEPNFREWRVSVSGICVIGGLSQRPGLSQRFCNSLLQNCRGATVFGSWIGSRIAPHANAT